MRTVRFSGRSASEVTRPRQRISSAPKLTWKARNCAWPRFSVAPAVASSTYAISTAGSHHPSRRPGPVSTSSHTSQVTRYSIGSSSSICSSKRSVPWKAMLPSPTRTRSAKARRISRANRRVESPTTPATTIARLERVFQNSAMNGVTA